MPIQLTDDYIDYKAKQLIKHPEKMKNFDEKSSQKLYAYLVPQIDKIKYRELGKYDYQKV